MKCFGGVGITDDIFLCVCKTEAESIFTNRKLGGFNGLKRKFIKL